MANENENAVVNTAPTVSETPSNLVAKAEKPTLSPNPHGFGFVKQFLVTELPEEGVANAIYILKVQNDGKFVGYRLYKWINGAFVLFGATPDLVQKDGYRGTPKVASDNEPKVAYDHIFKGNVSVIGDFYYKGKEISLYIDKVAGAITQEELDAVVALLEAQINAKQDIIDGESLPSGTANKLVGLDSNGNLVQSPLPEGTVVVDTELDNESTNPVQNKKIADAIANEYDTTAAYNKGDLVIYDGGIYKCNEDSVTGAWNSDKWTVTNIGGELEQKANSSDLLDGSLIPAKSQVAEGLTTEVGNLDKTPFNFMTSGGQSDIETGLQKTLKLVGCNIGKNQLFDYTQHPTYTHNGVTYTNNNDGSYTLTGTATANSYYQTFNRSADNHYYLIIGCASGGSTSTYMIRIADGQGGDAGYDLGNGIIVKNTNAIGVYMRVVSGTDLGNGKKFTPKVIDLTQMLGSNDVVEAIIGNDTSKQVANLLKFLGGWLPSDYDTGSFATVKTKYIKSVGYNQWDEQTTFSGDNLSSTNFIKVLPNVEYYFKLPKNGSLQLYDQNKNFLDNASVTANTTITFNNRVGYIKFTIGSYGTTYNHDICIFIYWDGSKITYEPYEEKIEELPNKTLHGILKVDSDGNVYADGDELYPDSSNNKKRYEYKKFVGGSDENWTLLGTESNYIRFAIARGSCKENTLNLNNNWGYDVVSLAPQSSDNGSKIWVSTSYINVFVPASLNIATASAFKTYLASNNLEIVAELDEETSLTADNFNENLWADDFGTLEMLDENGNRIVGLQGCEIFYKANIAGFAESVYVKADGKPENIVIKDELTTEETARTGQDTILQNAIGGTLRQCLCVKETLDFEDTDFKDLSAINGWVYSSAQTRFYTTISFAKGSGDNNTPSKLLSTLYKNVSYVTLTSGSGDMEIAISSDGLALTVRDNSCAGSVDTFLQKVKGVLLACEKASE